MKLLVGLGNPGPRYAGTRHNVGFDVLERLAAPPLPSRERFGGRFARIRLGERDVGLLAPLTYMNRSGEAVQRARAFFRLPLEDVLVVHDDLDLDFGSVRLKRGGGAGGHNGLKSIIEHGGGRTFPRVRVGIGRPARGEITPWVLGKWSDEESAALEDVLDTAARAAEKALRDGLDEAMAEFHRRS